MYCYYYYILNFVNKKLVEICFLSSYKYLLNNLLAFGCKAWPGKIFTIWPFTGKVCHTFEVEYGREVMETGRDDAHSFGLGHCGIGVEGAEIWW